MATHFNIPAWRILWTEEPRRLQSIGLERVGHDWSDLACTDLQPESKNQIDGLQSPDWLAGQACVVSRQSMLQDLSSERCSLSQVNISQLCVFIPLVSVSFSSIKPGCTWLYQDIVTLKLNSKVGT